MENDHLKDIWKQEEIKTAPEVSLEKSTEIHLPLEKIRKNMRMEFWSNLLIFIVILVSLFWIKDAKVRTYSIMLALTAILVSAFYYAKFFKLYKEISFQNFSTKDSLISLKHQFELNEQYYTSYYVAFAPIIVCTYILMFQNLNVYQQYSEAKFIGTFVSTVVLGIFLLYYLGKWWFNYFYGKYINQVSKFVFEISGVENNINIESNFYETKNKNKFISKTELFFNKFFGKGNNTLLLLLKFIVAIFLLCFIIGFVMGYLGLEIK